MFIQSDWAAYEEARQRVIHSETLDVFAARDTAYSWHGGQWSPLYSFASTEAVIHSEEHRESLRGEIRQCLKMAQKDPDPSHLTDLENLLAVVDALPVKPG